VSESREPPSGAERARPDLGSGEAARPTSATVQCSRPAAESDDSSRRAGECSQAPAESGESFRSSGAPSRPATEPSESSPAAREQGASSRLAAGSFRPAAEPGDCARSVAGSSGSAAEPGQSSQAVESLPPAAEPGASLRDPERRRALLATIETWLDEVGEPEPPPPGIAAEAMADTESGPDLYSVLAQLAALTRETQLQGRATNRLHAELGETLNRLLEQQVGSQDAVTRRLVDARREARGELVAELLEVRDRLARGLGEARSWSTAPRWRSTGSTTPCGGSTCTRSPPGARRSTPG
jgi:hypothetical protein